MFRLAEFLGARYGSDRIVAPGAGQNLPVLSLDAVTLDQLYSADAFTGFLGGVYVGGAA